MKVRTTNPQHPHPPTTIHSPQHNTTGEIVAWTFPATQNVRQTVSRNGSSLAGGFYSGAIGNGATSFTFQFTATGTYYYKSEGELSKRQEEEEGDEEEEARFDARAKPIIPYAGTIVVRKSLSACQCLDQATCTFTHAQVTQCEAQLQSVISNVALLTTGYETCLGNLAATVPGLSPLGPQLSTAINDLQQCETNLANCQAAGRAIRKQGILPPPPPQSNAFSLYRCCSGEDHCSVQQPAGLLR